MATPKDKLNKAHEHQAHTDTSVTHNQRAAWQEALDRHVSIPASRSVEAAEVFRDFAGSWAASYEMGFGGATQQAGAIGVPAHQRKVNLLGQPGPPEINFRPYDWGTHRFGPKGPALLGHPISFEVIGPTQKTRLTDWQWNVTDNAPSATVGDVITLDREGADDVSATSLVGAAATQTWVQQVVGGPTTLEDYYGFTNLDDYDNGGLYLVVTMGGAKGDLSDPSTRGGPGDGVIGDPTGAVGPGNEVRAGAEPLQISSKTEIFRIVQMDNAAKSFTLDPAKHLSDYFQWSRGTTKIIRSVMLIAPKATRLVAVPGSGDGTPAGATTFAVVPPERALLNDYTPPYTLWVDPAAGGIHDPWQGPFVAGPVGIKGEASAYGFRPRLPIETPQEISGAAAPDSFTTVAAPILTDYPDITLPLESGVGWTPPTKSTTGRLVNIHEVELVGAAATFDVTTGRWVADPGYEWLMGYHEVVEEQFLGADVTGLRIRRIPEVNPTTGVPFYTPGDALNAEYTVGVNDGIRYKLSWHDPIETLWLSPHASIDKLSQARLTNLIDPNWLNEAHSLKQLGDWPDQKPFVHSRPDKAIFDTSTSGAGASGSNANPGNLLDLGFRMVLFPAKDGGAGYLVPDYDNPISSREIVIDRNSTAEEQWWDVDYSAGLVTLSHIPSMPGPMAPAGIISVFVAGPFAGGGAGLDFDDNGGGGPFTITRNDGGSFITDGFKVGQTFTVSESESGNDETYTIASVTATVLGVPHPTVIAAGRPFANWTDDNTAVITSGDNPRDEVVLFASCVPYSREAGQLGSNIRVTAGQTDVLGLACGGSQGGANADVFSERRYWRIAGDNTTPQTFSSGVHQTLELLDTVLATDIPTEGFIEIIEGLDPEGTPAFLDNNTHSVSTFGFRYNDGVGGVYGGTALENVFGGVGEIGGGGADTPQTITVDSDNPYLAVLRRNVVLPNTLTGEVGTDYPHDVTYGSASRATALRFRHAKLTKQVDGSVVVEGLDELAQQHEKLFDDILSSWVVEGFDFTPGGGALDADFGAGTVLIEGVRSEMAPSALTFPATDDIYYIFIEPQGGDPTCPAITYQVGMPLPTNSCVLLGMGVVSGTGTVLTWTDLRYFLRDIDLRDDILVGKPPSGHPTFASDQPHFEELADAVRYACEVMQYRRSAAPSTNAFGRYVRIKVVGPTYEDDDKLPIQFTSHGIIIEGNAVKRDGTHQGFGAQTKNGQAVSWAANKPLFDLNGQSNLTFRNLTLEYRDIGQADPSTLVRSAFVNYAGDASLCAYITLDDVHLISTLEAGTPSYVFANAFVHMTQGNFAEWRIRNCTTQTTDVGVYFGGDQSLGKTVATVVDIHVENNLLAGVWTAGDDTAVGVDRVQFQQGFNSAGHPEVYGAVVFAAKVGVGGCVVRGNRLSGWAGFGIFDNGGTDCLYEGNQISDIGDAGILHGSVGLFYTTTTVGGNRIISNSLEGVHALSVTGGAGTINQAAVDGFAWSEKRGIALDQNTTSTMVHGNYVDMYGGNPVVDADLHVQATFVSAVGNTFDTGRVFTSSDATEFILASTNITVGGVKAVGSPTIIADCVIGGLVDLPDASVLADSVVKLSVTSTGVGCLVTGNYIVDPPPGGGPSASGITLGANNVFSNNIYRGTDDEAIITVGAESTLSGNSLYDQANPSGGTIELIGTTDIIIVGNTFDTLRYDPLIGIGDSTRHIFANNIFEVMLFLEDQRNMQNSIFMGNYGDMVADDARATVDNSRNMVIGNLFPTAALGWGGDSNTFVGNTLKQYMVIGSTLAAADNNIFAQNTVLGSVDTAIAVPAYGLAVANYWASIVVYGARNVITGNVFADGMHTLSSSHGIIVTGNRFGDRSPTAKSSSLFTGNSPVITGNYFYEALATTTNCGVVVTGLLAVVTGNAIDEGRLDIQGNDSMVSGNLVGATGAGSDENEILVIGSRNNVNGNYVGGGITVNGGADHVISNNTLYEANGGNPNDITVANPVAGCVINGNKLVSIESSIIVDGPFTTIVGNWVGNSISMGAAADDCVCEANVVKGGIGIDSDGLRALIVGNRVSQGDILVSGNFSVISGNITGQVTKGSLIISADDCTVQGNSAWATIGVSPGKARATINGNWTNVNIDVRDCDDYVVLGNTVVGDILADDSTAPTSVETGIIVGNRANRISGAVGGAGSTIPSTGMVVLGNKVANTMTVFSVDPGTDSVGVTAANQIIDFNVKA